MSNSNPLLLPFETPYELPPFDQIEISHYQPAIEYAISEARKEIEVIANQTDAPTFENTIEKMEASGELLGRVTSILFNLNSAETSTELQQVAQEVSPMLATFDSEVKQNEALFSRINTLYQEKEQLGLTREQARLLDKTYQSFIRNGAGLSPEKKKRFLEISVELSKLQLTFSEHVLAETNAFELWIEKEEDLAGLPADYKSRAAAQAQSKGREGTWLITLQAPSYLPFMEYADNRRLREKLYKAYMTKAFKGNEYDNQTYIREIVSLRHELANLLGYPTYADYVLEQRMAGSVDRVQSFLHDLLDRALTPAKKEVDELKEFMSSIGVEHELERWDWAYYSEKLRKKKYDLDNELIKPYFKLENVIDGVFEVTRRLYGLTFKENKQLPVYHQDVLAYEVYDSNDLLKSIFYADFFPRDGKRPGAWMTSFKEQQRLYGKEVIPVISIVCNFTPSSPDSPSLLTFEEVTTLFHEFGHALHGMLSDVTYPSLSGTSVFWDFVELPSQIFENWCYEREALSLFAKHFETGEIIPDAYIERIRAAATYHEAYATVRQLSFGLLDLHYHSLHQDTMGRLEDIDTFEREAMAPTELFPGVAGTNMSVQFSHIFAGGYAAGYYSYKWAEVLDADAFELFKEQGVFDRDTAESFKSNVLSKGGTEDPSILYRRFRGKDPDPNALLRRAGLI